MWVVFRTRVYSVLLLKASVTFMTVTVRPEGPYCAATVFRKADARAVSVAAVGAHVTGSKAARGGNHWSVGGRRRPGVVLASTRALLIPVAGRFWKAKRTRIGGSDVGAVVGTAVALGASGAGAGCGIATVTAGGTTDTAPTVTPVLAAMVVVMLPETARAKTCVMGKQGA